MCLAKQKQTSKKDMGQKKTACLMILNIPKFECQSQGYTSQTGGSGGDFQMTSGCCYCHTHSSFEQSLSLLPYQSLCLGIEQSLSLLSYQSLCLGFELARPFTVAIKVPINAQMCVPYTLELKRTH